MVVTGGRKTVMDSLAQLFLIIGCIYCFIGQYLAKEYCLRDIFSPTCPDGEVIVMTVAKFGRMKVGKCVIADLGFQGCFDDVLHILDDSCSGKNKCKYPIFEKELEESIACPRGLKSYLEAEYTCIPVVTMMTNQCQNTQSRKLPGNSGYLSSHVARDNSCGSIKMPWRIEVEPGQRVNITIIHFQNKKNNRNSKGCRPLGYIYEVGHRSNTSICSPKQREEHIYESNGRSLEIGISTQHNTGDFLLQYKVFGCPDYEISQRAWYKRQGDSATAGCVGTDSVWNLECVDSRWIGHIENCTEDEAPRTAQVSSQWLDDKPDFTTIVLVMIGGGFVVLLIICVALIIIKFRRSSPVPPSSNTIMRKDYNVSHPIYDASEESSHYKSLKSRGSNPSRSVSYTVPRHVQDQEAFNTQFRPSSHVFSSTLPRNTPALPFPPDTKYEDESDASPCEGPGNYHAPNYFVLDQNYINN